MQSTANTLREIAALIDGGMPAPISITTYGRPSVLVKPADLGYWISRMDLPEPWWEGDAGCPQHARWDRGAFDGHDYTIASVSTANMAVA